LEKTPAAAPGAGLRAWCLGLGLLLLPPLLWIGPTGTLLAALQARVFDGWQILAPRARLAHPVVVVAIDDHSLERLGQWPWSRLRLAGLIDTIAAEGALAVGIDILLREPDRLSPENYALSLPGQADARLAPALEALPRHDPALAGALARLPSVLAVALARRGTRSPGRPAPALARFQGTEPLHLPAFTASQRSLPIFEEAAASVAMINAEAEDGLIRRIPLLARLGPETFTNLGVETLRQAIGAGALALRRDTLGDHWLDLGEASLPVDGQGRLWLHYTAPAGAGTPTALPVVSAADVLAGTFEPNTFHNRVVLLGFTAQGLLDRVSTPHGDQRPGVYVHAEIIESVVQGRLLRRPGWAPLVEGLAYLLLTGAFALALRLERRRSVLLVGLVPILLAPAAAFAAFLTFGLLIDGVLPAAGAAGVGVGLLSAQLSASRRARRTLEARLQREREARARLDGELAAASRIQGGLLPRPEALAGAHGRVEVAAHMVPARSVGGDLYDFRLLAGERLFLGIGDVCDKGVPASLFMALTQSLLRSAMHQHPDDLARAVTLAAAELDRDNPEGMFVTWVGLLLDLNSGELAVLNAGHEYPFIGGPGGWRAFACEGGPPLCALPGFPWREERTTWPVGATVLLYTDGLTEARAPDGELYGRDRLAAFLGCHPGDIAPGLLLAALQAEVHRFTAGTDLPDDLAILAVRYHGQAPVNAR